MAPQVSVLMPVFNAEPFVREAAESILAQTFRDFEFIVVDDGSTDSSLATLRELARNDGRMRVITRENRGLIDTRNELLREARGALVAWMDADDVSYPERLARQVTAFESEPELVCFGASREHVDPEGMPIEHSVAITDRAEIRRAFSNGDGVYFATTMMRRDAILRVGGFRAPFVVGEDLDLILRLAEIGQVANTDAVLLKYRQHVRSISRQLRERWDAIRGVILELAEERKNTGTDRLQRGEEVLFPGEVARPSLPDACEVHVNWTRQALASGFTKTARKHAFMALAQNPRSLAAWRSALRVALGAPPRTT